MQQPETSSGASVSRWERLLPFLVVFTSSMGVMIIELTASRLVSKYFGTSLFTWTGVIGVVLGGISLGNYIGGRIADRFNPTKVMAPILLITSALVLLIFVMDLGLSTLLREDRVSFLSSGVLLQSILLIVVLFLAPATSFGLVSPVMAKYALVRNPTIGKTVGGIYAAGAVGSIVGTFLSGFLLIPLLGIRAIIFLVAGVLALLALLVHGNRFLSVGWAAGVLVLYLLAPAATTAARVLYSTDSRYSHITVSEREEDGTTERVLIMDGLIHNRIEPGNPDNLLYEYERVFAALTRQAVGQDDHAPPLRTLTLGAGGLTFPTYLERHFESANTVVEIDPEVIRVARNYFEVPADTRLDLVIQDARVYVNRLRGEPRFDLIFLDAFDSYSVPSHLTTAEFDRSVRSLLRDEGLFVVNLIDVFEIGRFLGAYLGTLETVFPAIRVYVPVSFDRGARTTFVLAAGSGALPPEMLRDHRGGPLVRALTESELEDLRQRNRVGVLTDNHAPVDNLMAPVFLDTVR